MTDLLSIGSSGINVYQRALGTVANNIANLNTEGYSKQTTEITQNEPQAAGRGFIGTGAYFNRVSRQYDSFLEQSLQRATADLESQQSNAEYSTRLLDFLGDDDIGLVSSLNKFFSSAQQLTTDPASSAYRSTMLRSSEELATRVNSLAEQLDDLGNQAFSAIEAEVISLNSLATQLGAMNGQLLRKKSELDQPPALLDRRDQLLRDISEYAGITTRVNSQGLVSVSLSGSTSKGLLVDGLSVRSLAAARDPNDPETVSFSLNGDGGVEQLTGVRSGSISGYANFLSGSLKQSKVGLNDLVRLFADEVNAIQTAGLDLNGDMGEPLFAIEPAISVDQSNARGALTVSTRPLNENVQTFRDLALTWNASNGLWSGVDPQTGQVVSSDDQGRIAIANIAVEFSGTPQDGDRVLLAASNAPALGLRVALETGSQLAAASLFRVTPAETNRGGAVSSVQFDPTRSVSGFEPLASSASYQGSTRAPLGVISPGMSEVVLELDPNDASSATLQLVTRDGRQLIGDENAESLLTTAPEFFANGSTFDAQYRNQLDASSGSYKDYQIEYGAFADSSAVTYLTPLSTFAFNDTSGANFTSGFLEFTVQGPETETTLALESADVPQSTLGAVSVVDDIVYLGDGALANQVGTITYPFGSANSGDSRLRVELTGADVSGDVIDQIAQKLLVSDDRDLVGATHPYRADLLVQAYDQTGTLRLSTDLAMDSAQLIEAGAYRADAAVQVATIRSERIARTTQTGEIISAGQLSLNGVELGDLTIGQAGVEGYGALSALDIAEWIDQAQISQITVETQNTIRVESNDLNLVGPGLTINGVAVDSPATGTQTNFSHIEDVMGGINAISDVTGVEASIDLTGALILRNSDGRGANISLGAVSTDATNTLGRANGVVTGTFEIRQTSDSTQTILLAIEDGIPADLNTLGLNTQIRIRGAIDEEIGVFMTGGDGIVETQQLASNIEIADGLRARLFEARITDDGFLEVHDRSTDTVVARRTYAGETSIDYQGITIQLRAAAEAGDVLTIDGNNTGPGQAFDAQGNNQNFMRIVDLERSEVVQGLTITDAYLSIVGDAGNQATQAEISVEALSILKDQAIEARDRVSGVSLDQEAADLIRFQQAYQASAQVMQVATRLFDAILQVR